MAGLANRDGFSAWAALVPLLYVADPEGWVDTVAGLGARHRDLVLLGAGQLPFAAFERLAERLVADGLPLALATCLVTKRAAADEGDHGAVVDAWLHRLGGEPAAVRATVARQLEAEAPADALALWQHLDGPAASVGRARCHAGLGDLAAAADALAGVDLTALAPLDVLFVASVAAAAGDTATAAALVDALGPAADELPAGAVADLAGLLSAETLA
jgi:hypothetical protein